MDCKMNASIKQITQNKTGEKRKGKFSHREIHDPENCRRNNNAGNWRHEKPFFITWKMMMISVHDINEFLCRLAVRNGMKSETVHQVFKESPKKTSCEECEEYTRITEIQPKMAQVNKKNDYR